MRSDLIGIVADKINEADEKLQEAKGRLDQCWILSEKDTLGPDKPLKMSKATILKA